MKRAMIALASALMMTAPVAASADGPHQWFAERATQANLLEAALGRLAADKAEAAEVRNFAEKMVTEHEEAQERLAEAAGRMAIEPPQGLDEQGEAVLSELQGLSGATFDRAYMDRMVEAHETAVTLHQEYGQDPETPLQTYAMDTSRVLLAHRELAESVRAETR
jgi:putative membrane protein